MIELRRIMSGESLMCDMIESSVDGKRQKGRERKGMMNIVGKDIDR